MVGALLLLLLSRSEKDRQSLVLPGNDGGGYMATAAVVADSTAEATADTAVHTYAAAVQGPCCAMAKNKRWKIPKSEAKTSDISNLAFLACIRAQSGRRESPELSSPRKGQIRLLFGK